MRPTKVRLLVAIAALLAALTWGLLHVLDSNGGVTAIPSVPWTGPVGLLLLALGIGVLALSLRARLRGDDGTKPVPPLTAARMVSLAKATSHAAALITGLYLGVLAFALVDIGAGLLTGRALPAAASTLAGALLVAAGLALERVLRVPDDDVDGIPPSGVSAQ